MSDIKFRLAAKTDMGCARTNNEDNFQAAADLSQPTMTWVNNQTYDLGEKGALLVVADGMGGMNAGEVASAIAIDTVREFFTPERITPEVLKTRFTIEKFMKDVVVEADRRIKSRSTSETRGMGTTIVMAWLLEGQCYVCWCGDSRAYIYNPANGLFQVTKDHSYVQALVDLGKITAEEAFDYPDNNVITRCLCDSHQKAEPECLLQPQPLCDGDIILLCSDGLNGMLRDNQISKLINEGPDDVNLLTDVLIDGALAAGGNDNVTVALAHIDSGGVKATEARMPAKDVPKPAVTPAPKATSAEVKTSASSTQEPAANPKPDKTKGKKTPGWVWGIVGFIAAVALCAGAYFYINKSDGQSGEEAVERQTDVYEDDAELTEDMIEPEIFDTETQPAETKVKGKPAQGNAPEETAPAASEGDQTPLKPKGVISQVSGKAEEVTEPEKQETPKEVAPVKPVKPVPTEPAKPEQPAVEPTSPATDPNLQPAQ